VEEALAVDKPQRAALYSTALRSPAGACSTASTAATMSHRGGEEEAVVATTAATAREKACVCQKASIVTSQAEETRGHPCLAAVVVEGNVVDADQVRGGRKPAAVVAGEEGETMANPLEARDRRRRPRSWMLRWKTTSAAAAAAAAVAVLAQRPTTDSNKMAAERRLLPLLRLEMTTST
jgi:hypothetical protein